ncbi:MAG: ACT domain-containing protein [Candidatus Diapherotrites archaeon]
MGEFLAKLDPKIVDGNYWICTIKTHSEVPENAIATFKEEKGISIILKQETKPEFECTEAKAMISVGIETPQGAEAFLSKIMSAIAEADDLCTYVYSAYYQDHLFVPKEKAEEVIEVLNKLKSRYH